jgi:hypothetical protein
MSVNWAEPWNGQNWKLIAHVHGKRRRERVEEFPGA